MFSFNLTQCVGLQAIWTQDPYRVLQNLISDTHMRFSYKQLMCAYFLGLVLLSPFNQASSKLKLSLYRNDLRFYSQIIKSTLKFRQQNILRKGSFHQYLHSESMFALHVCNFHHLNSSVLFTYKAVAFKDNLTLFMLNKNQTIIYTPNT